MEPSEKVWPASICSGAKFEQDLYTFSRLDLIAATRKVFLPFGPTWLNLLLLHHVVMTGFSKRFQRIAFGFFLGEHEVRLWFNFSRANDVSAGAFRGSLFLPSDLDHTPTGPWPEKPRSDPWRPLEGCLSANNFIK